MYITTPRLIIRDYSPADLQDLHEIFSDPEVMAYCEPAYTAEQTRDILDIFIRRSIAYAVVLKATGKVIGHALFAQLPPPDAPGTYEIGWIYNRSFWGQGYAFEASKALMDHGFHNLPLNKITAETIDPIRSVGLMKKLGMHHEATLPAHTQDLQGNWTDVQRYAICSPLEE